MREYNERAKEGASIWALEGHRGQGADMKNIEWGRKSKGGEPYVSESNVLFSPPTDPRGFLSYPLAVYRYTRLYAVYVLFGVDA